MLIKQIPVGPLMANCFIVGCKKTKQAAVIDPGGDVDKILLALAESKLTVKYILNTHGHFDHIGGNKRLKDVTKALILIHKEDAPMLEHASKSAAVWGMPVSDSPPADQLIKDNDEIVVGAFKLKVIHTPGHSPGGVSFYTPNVVFVGDTLFEGSIGRTDFPGGSYETLISSVETKLFPLGDDTIVHTGHGPSTTIASERRSNPFFT